MALQGSWNNVHTAENGHQVTHGRISISQPEPTSKHDFGLRGQLMMSRSGNDSDSTRYSTSPMTIHLLQFQYVLDGIVRRVTVDPIPKRHAIDGIVSSRYTWIDA